MGKRHHSKVEIARIEARMGFLRHMLVNHDNRGCVLVFSDNNCRERMISGRVDDNSKRIVFKGKIVTETAGSVRDPLLALHPNGDRLAICRGEPGDSIFIHGPSGPEHTYHNPENFKVCGLTWLPHGRLAWYGTEEEEEHDERSDEGESTPRRMPKKSWSCFSNGEDVTDRLDFQKVHLGEREAVIVREDGLRYTVHDDGSRDDYREDCCDSIRCSCRREDGDSRKARVRAEAIHGQSNLRIKFADYCGPSFDSLSPYGFTPRDFAYNADRSRVGYVGVSFTRTANALQAAWLQVERYVPADHIIENPFLAWPMAVLLNPYFGPLYYYLDRVAKRYQIVDHDKVWEKKWRQPPTDVFYTPFNELAVVCQEGDAQRLVIDGRPGPRFDWITNARVLGSDGQVCYAAGQGDKIFRVTV